MNNLEDMLSDITIEDGGQVYDLAQVILKEMSKGPIEEDGTRRLFKVNSEGIVVTDQWTTGFTVQVHPHVQQPERNNPFLSILRSLEANDWWLSITFNPITLVRDNQVTVHYQKAAGLLYHTKSHDEIRRKARQYGQRLYVDHALCETIGTRMSSFVGSDWTVEYETNYKGQQVFPYAN
jgi:hypothetical protein